MADLPIHNEDRNKTLATLLDELCQNIYSSERIKEFAAEFTNLCDIGEGYLHIPYGVISGNITLLYGKYGMDHVVQIPDNLVEITNTLRETIDNVELTPEEKRRYVQAYQSVVSLQDFVSMEVIRADQMDRQFKKAVEQTTATLDKANRLNENAQQLEGDINKINQSATETLEKARKVSRDAQNLKTEVITILTIFAAIILAFTGGLTILGEAVVAVVDTPLYQVLLVSLFCIGGLFNTIYLLLNVVAHISGKNLSLDCKYGECKECDQKEECKGFSRFIRRSPYVFGFNVLLFLVICAVINLNACGLLG